MVGGAMYGSVEEVAFRDRRCEAGGGRRTGNASAAGDTFRDRVEGVASRDLGDDAAAARWVGIVAADGVEFLWEGVGDIAGGEFRAGGVGAVLRPHVRPFQDRRITVGQNSSEDIPKYVTNRIEKR